MENKKLGFIIIIIVILFSISIFIFKSQVDNLIMLQMSSSGGTCFDEQGNCLHQQSNVPLYLGTVSAILLLILSLYLIFNNEKPDTKKSETYKHQIKSKDIKAEDYDNILKDLNDDEKSVFQEIINAKGTIFQSELAEITSLSKVKVTRILDKLEGRNLIERKRRGMTNVVILKHN